MQLAKMLRYLSYTSLCDATFVLFLVSWLVTRQIGLFLVIKTSYVEAPKYIPFEWAPEKGRYLTETAYYTFIGMLSILWILCAVWFGTALNVALRVVRGLGAEDSRSDDEDECGASGELELDECAALLEQVPQLVGTSVTSEFNEPRLDGQTNYDLKKRK